MPDNMIQKGINYQPILKKREDSMVHQISLDGKPILILSESISIIYY